MLIKTTVDKEYEGAVVLNRYEFDAEKNETVSTPLWITEIDYDNAFVESLTEEVSKWYVHTTSIYDYESSTDAGDGRDDYSKEETDVEISLDICIVKDGVFEGVVCKAFDQESFISKNNPKIRIGDPKNYGGKGYHFYRNMYFELRRK